MLNQLLSFYKLEFYIFLIQISLFVLQIIAYWFLFKKAGVAGWKSIIPIYNNYKMYQIVWDVKYFGAYLVLAMINGIFNYLLQSVFTVGVLALIFSIIRFIVLMMSCLVDFFFCRKLAFAYGKSSGFAVGLFFLFPIFILILGLGNSRFVRKI